MGAGALAAPMVLNVDPTGADTAIVTVTNPSVIKGAGLDLPPLPTSSGR